LTGFFIAFFTFICKYNAIGVVMGYKPALNKAWKKVEDVIQAKRDTVKFLADEYEITLDSRNILSLSCNAPASDHISILVLHYLVQKTKGLPEVRAEWISFKELPGGQGYFDAFKKRALNPLIRKYGDSPQSLLNCLDRLPAKKIQYGDCGVIIEAFENVPVLVTVYGQDEEFSAEANILFDRSITEIFCTEDIAVLSDIISRTV